MQLKKRAGVVTSLTSAAVVALTLSACGSSSSSSSATTAGSTSGSSTQATSAATSSSATAKTIDINVGTKTPIRLSTGKLKIAILMNDTANTYEQDVAKAAVDQAEAYGWSAKVFDPDFNTQTQLNEIQTIASTHEFDAVAVIADNGALECKAITQTLPAANILVSVGVQQLCNNESATGSGLWSPGTLDWVGGSGTTAQFIESWLNAAAQSNPGAQNAVFVGGPQNITVTQLDESIIKSWQQKHPDFKIANFVYTDFTTPTTYTDMLAFLQAHKSTTVILSSYSPDLTRGVIEAVDQLGLGGKVKIVDSGASTYSYQELASGGIEWTTPLFPTEDGQYMIQSIRAAQEGKAPVRFISDIPSSLGSISHLPILTKKNMGIFKPQF